MNHLLGPYACRRPHWWTPMRRRTRATNIPGRNISIAPKNIKWQPWIVCLWLCCILFSTKVTPSWGNFCCPEEVCTLPKWDSIFKQNTLFHQRLIDMKTCMVPWKSQPWPSVFTFPSEGWGWLDQIPFYKILSTHPTGVASILRALRFSDILSKRLP